MSHKKITSASLKKIGVPKTVREKYDKLKKTPFFKKVTEINYEQRLPILRLHYYKL